MTYKDIMKNALDLWQAFRNALPEGTSCAKVLSTWSRGKDLTKREAHDIHEIAFMLLITQGKASTKASILGWLMSGQDLDDITAATKLGCRSLSSTISKLRSEGWGIGKDLKRTKAGQMSTFYFLSEVR